jgi:hypothetical protein
MERSLYRRDRAVVIGPKAEICIHSLRKNAPSFVDASTSPHPVKRNLRLLQGERRLEADAVLVEDGWL